MGVTAGGRLGSCCQSFLEILEEEVWTSQDLRQQPAKANSAEAVLVAGTEPGHVLDCRVRSQVLATYRMTSWAVGAHCMGSLCARMYALITGGGCTFGRDLDLVVPAGDRSHFEHELAAGDPSLGYQLTQGGRSEPVSHLQHPVTVRRQHSKSFPRLATRHPCGQRCLGKGAARGTGCTMSSWTPWMAILHVCRLSQAFLPT